MSNAVEILLERKALRIAWIIDTEEALSRVPLFRATTPGATAAPKIYQCPVCWVQQERRETLELRDLPYTKDRIMRCKTCGDLTTIHSHVLEEFQR